MSAAQAQNGPTNSQSPSLSPASLPSRSFFWTAGTLLLIAIIGIRLAASTPNIMTRLTYLPADWLVIALASSIVLLCTILIVSHTRSNAFPVFIRFIFVFSVAFVVTLVIDTAVLERIIDRPSGVQYNFLSAGPVWKNSTGISSFDFTLDHIISVLPAYLIGLVLSFIPIVAVGIYYTNAQRATTSLTQRLPFYLKENHLYLESLFYFRRRTVDYVFLMSSATMLGIGFLVTMITVHGLLINEAVHALRILQKDNQINPFFSIPVFAAFTFIGSYIFSIREIVHHLERDETDPTMYYFIGSRFVGAFLLSIIAFIILNGLKASINQSNIPLVVIALVIIGLFSFTTIDFLIGFAIRVLLGRSGVKLTDARSVLGGYISDASEIDIARIPDLDNQTIEKLRSMDLGSAGKLAFANPYIVWARTKFSLIFVVELISRAYLLFVVGPQIHQLLVREGIPSSTLYKGLLAHLGDPAPVSSPKQNENKSIEGNESGNPAQASTDHVSSSDPHTWPLLDRLKAIVDENILRRHYVMFNNSVTQKKISELAYDLQCIAPEQLKEEVKARRKYVKEAVEQCIGRIG